MRAVVRKDCEYKDYAEMVDQVDSTMPYGMLECRYNKRLKIAFLYFWDTDYIPKEWEQWIVRPVNKKSEEKDTSEEYE